MGNGNAQGSQSVLSTNTLNAPAQVLCYFIFIVCLFTFYSDDKVKIHLRLHVNIYRDFRYLCILPFYNLKTFELKVCLCVIFTNEDVSM